MHRRLLRLASLVALATVLPLVVGAQEPDPAAQVDEELTVTAQRVEQSLQDVPISVIALSGEALEEQGVVDVQGLAESAPGLVVSSQSSSTGELALTIRGIGSNTFGLGTESTVGYYVDGVYVPRPQAFVNQFLDIERIEVLRGPQGTLWGRNSTGGAINVVTRGPSGDFHGQIAASFGEFDTSHSAEEQRLAASITGPLSERVWGRLSGSLTQSDDYTFNELIGRTVDNVDGWGLRGAFTFLPTDSLSIRLSADITDDDSHNNFNLKAGLVDSTSTLGTLNRFFGFSDPADVRRIAANVPPTSTYEESGFSVDLNWVLGSSGTNLQSLTSFREFDSARRSDIDATPLDFVENTGTFDVEWWSQEFKLNGGNERLDWIAGAYLFHEEGMTTVDTITDLALFEVQFFASNPGLFLFNPVDFCSLGFLAPTSLCGINYYGAIAPFLGLSLPGNLTTGNFFVTDLETDSYAAYGQVYWHLNDRFTLTTGLRYTNDDKDHAQQTIDFLTQAPLAQADSDSWDALTPQIGLEYRPNDNTLVYGSVTTGFKSGGFNSISLQSSFDEETITSYEVGVKSSLADRRVRLNAALFHYEYDDLQVAVLFPDRSVVENAAEASVDGLEVDLAIRPNRRFSIDLGLSFLDDEYDQFISQNPLEVARAQDALTAAGNFDQLQIFLAGAAVPLSDLSGRSLTRAPDFTASAALQYRIPLGSAGSLTARGQWYYSDEITFDPFETFVQPSYDTLAANLRWAPQSERFFVNLYGRNLGDEEYITQEFFARVTGSLRVWAPPSQYGLQIGFDF